MCVVPNSIYSIQNTKMLYLAILVSVAMTAALAAPNLKYGTAGRIVNGTEAEDGQYPFMVSIQYLTFHSHLCGASILNENYILTAAHCVDWFYPSELSILAGTNKLSSDNPQYAVSKKIVHQKFSQEDNFLNDIALLKVVTPIIFSQLVQPVTLPAAMEDTPKDTPVTVIGWGRPYDEGEYMENLQTVEIKVYSDEECQEIHSTRPPHDSNICAGVPEGGKGQCEGDSGGPLLANGHQVGIVSWSQKPCTIAPYPGVYTEVSYYIDWINENTS